MGKADRGKNRGKSPGVAQGKAIERALSDINGQKRRRKEELQKYAPLILAVIRDHDNPRKFEYHEQAYALKAIWNYLADDEISGEVRDALFLLFDKLRFAEGKQKINLNVDTKSLKLATSDMSAKVLMDGWSMFRQKFKDNPVVVYKAGMKILQTWTILEFNTGIQAMKKDLSWKKIVRDVEKIRVTDNAGAAASSSNQGTESGSDSSSQHDASGATTSIQIPGFGSDEIAALVASVKTTAEEANASDCVVTCDAPATIRESGDEGTESSSDSSSQHDASGATTSIQLPGFGSDDIAALEASVKTTAEEVHASDCVVNEVFSCDAPTATHEVTGDVDELNLIMGEIAINEEGTLTTETQEILECGSTASAQLLEDTNTMPSSEQGPEGWMGTQFHCDQMPPNNQGDSGSGGGWSLFGSDMRDVLFPGFNFPK